MITSTSNPHIKNIRKLSQKKYRRESGLFYVEGLRPITSALNHAAQVIELIYCPELLESDFGWELLRHAEQQNINILEVNRLVFESISLKEGPQGLCALVKQNIQELGAHTEVQGVWGALEGVQDPGKLGSVLRTLDAVGGNGLLLVGEGTDATHPTSVRASMGAIFTIPIFQTSLENFLVWKKDHPLVALIGAVCEDVQDYCDYYSERDMLLLMGSEQKGMPPQAQDICTGLVNIPMIGSVDSLNLANATSVLLYEIFDQMHPLRKK